MKLTRILLLFALLAPIAGFAQSSETVTIPKDQLTPEQRAKLDKEELDEKVQQYGKWVGAGHEVGVAVNESLSAITDNATKFAQSGPGKVTMFLVAWKVVGNDIYGLGVGLILLFSVLPVLIWSYWRTCVPRRILLEDSKEHGKKWQLLNDPSQENTPRGGVSDLLITRILHAVALFILGAFVCCSIYGCR